MKATHAPVFLPTNKGLSAGPEQITKALSFSNGLSSFLFLFMYSVSTAKRGEDRASLVRLVPEAGCLREGGCGVLNLLETQVRTRREADAHPLFSDFVLL